MGFSEECSFPLYWICYKSKKFRNLVHNYLWLSEDYYVIEFIQDIWSETKSDLKKVCTVFYTNI